MNLFTAFARTAEAQPGKAAVYWGDDEHPYELLLAQSKWLALRLRELGVKPGDRVGLWLKNCPEFVPALFAVLACGAVVVPINNFLKPEEILHILDDSGIDLMLTEEVMKPHLPALTAQRPNLRYWFVEEFSKPENRAAAVASLREATPHHAQRWHGGELQDRWQPKAQQQRQAQPQAQEAGLGARQWQADVDQP